MEFFVELMFFIVLGMVPTAFIWFPWYFICRRVKPDIEYSMLMDSGIFLLLGLGLATVAFMPPLYIVFIVLAVSMVGWSVAWYYFREKRKEGLEGFWIDDYRLLSNSLMVISFLLIFGMNYYCLVTNPSGHADFRIINVMYLFAVIALLALLLVLVVRVKRVKVDKGTSVITLALCLGGELDLLLLIKLGIAPMLYLDWIRMNL